MFLRDQRTNSVVKTQNLRALDAGDIFKKALLDRRLSFEVIQVINVDIRQNCCR